MNIYYVIGTETKKNKKGKPFEETEERAVPARDIDHLKEACDRFYIRWEFVRGPYKMGENWDRFKHNYERENKCQ